jgi:hypothetical protein
MPETKSASSPGRAVPREWHDSRRITPEQLAAAERAREYWVARGRAPAAAGTTPRQTRGG